MSRIPLVKASDPTELLVVPDDPSFDGDVHPTFVTEARHDSSFLHILREILVASHFGRELLLHPQLVDPVATVRTERSMREFDHDIGVRTALLLAGVANCHLRRESCVCKHGRILSLISA